MTKKDIANQIADQNGLNRKETLEVVNQVFELIKSEVQKGNTLNFRDFGTFTTRRYPACVVNSFGRENVSIPERKKVIFKPSKVSFKID